MAKPTPPTIGRLVHFVVTDGPAAGKHRPALIVDVDKKKGITLQVFTAGDGSPSVGDCLPGVFRQADVPYDEEAKPGTWHWPEAAAQDEPKSDEPAK